MCAVTCRSVMNASTHRASPQRGHWVTWSPKTLRNKAARSSRLRALWVSVFALVAACGRIGFDDLVLGDDGGDGGDGDSGVILPAQSYLKPMLPHDGDSFGWRIALSNDGLTMAVSSLGEDSNAVGVDGDQADRSTPASGAVFVFARDRAGPWTQQAYLKSSNPTAAAEFGLSIALSGDGNTIAVGAPFEGEGGHAYVFARTGTVWSHQENVFPIVSANTRYGSTVALSADGSVLVVGAPGDSSIGNQSGAIYTFTRVGSVWTQERFTKAPLPTALDTFGYDVGLSADGATVAITAPGRDNVATNDGAVYVFARPSWTQQTYLTQMSPAAGDLFGTSIALSADGNVLAVGARLFSAIDVGAVTTFSRVATTWSTDRFLQPSNAGANDFFGDEVALSGNGDYLASGAALEDSGAAMWGGNQADNSATDAGAVYVFGRTGGTWPQLHYVKPSNNRAASQFGKACALSYDGSTFACGAIGDPSATAADPDDASQPGAGAVHLYYKSL